MRKRLLSLFAGGALLGMTACANNNGAAKPDEQPTAQAPQEQERSELEQRIAQEATGSQPGKVASIDADDNQLMLDPYEPAAGEAELTLEDQTPVFRGGEQISMNPQDVLEEGADVNVYYQARQGEPPVVLGIAVLEPEQAQQLQEQFGVGGAGEQEQQEQQDQDQQRPEEFAEADKSQAGKIARVTEDQLVVQPYEEDAAPELLSLGDDVKVMRNGTELGKEALSEGADVRVFYDESGDQREVIGVEILSEDEAKELQ